MHQTKKCSICSGLKITMTFHFSSSEVVVFLVRRFLPWFGFLRKVVTSRLTVFSVVGVLAGFLLRVLVVFKKEWENEIAFALSSSDLRIS